VGGVMLEIKEYRNKGLVWYGSDTSRQVDRVSTGFSEADSILEGGLPAQGIIEVKTEFGVGELRFLMPYLKSKQEHGQLVFVDPPMQINAEFLLETEIDLPKTTILTPYQQDSALWAAEQCLNSGCCSTVVLWQQQLSIKQMRRLMLACEQGGASLVLIRHQDKRKSLLSMPSSISLSISSSEQGVALKVDKQKGGRSSERFTVSMLEQWPDLLPNPKRNKKVDMSNVIAFQHANSH
jgi:hypothetical protein